MFPLQQETSQLANTWLRGPEMIWLLRHLQDGAPGSKTRQLLRPDGPHPPTLAPRARAHHAAGAPPPRSAEDARGSLLTFPPWLPCPAPGLQPPPAPSSFNLTKRTLEAPSLLPTPNRPLSSGAPQALSRGSVEKQVRGRGERDNYNLGRFKSQAEKQGGSSSCPVWELGLSQKPSPTAQPP